MLILIRNSSIGLNETICPFPNCNFLLSVGPVTEVTLRKIITGFRGFGGGQWNGLGLAASSEQFLDDLLLLGPFSDLLALDFEHAALDRSFEPEMGQRLERMGLRKRKPQGIIMFAMSLPGYRKLKGTKMFSVVPKKTNANCFF